MATHTYKFQAFICCSATDQKWGQWLQRELQRFKVPKTLVGKVARDGILSQKAGAIFLDTQEQANTANIGAQQRAKLADAAYLLVICSPAAAKSQWINEQILEFKRLGKEARILCFIVEGEPNAADQPEIANTECFPHNIKFCLGPDGTLTTTRTEPIAADARIGKDGKANATLKLLAGILGVNFNDLRQREVLRAKRRKQLLVLFGTCVLLIVAAVWLRGQNIAREKAELQFRQQAAQAFAAAKTAMSEQRWDQAVAGWLSLADSKQFGYLSAPQQRELTMALHYALAQQDPVIAKLTDHVSDVISMDISPDGNLFASADMEGNIMLYRTDTWQKVHTDKDSTPRLIWFSQDNKLLVSQPHPQHAYVIDTSTPQVKLYTTDRFTMQPLEISHQQKQWLADDTETVYARAVSSGGQARQRQFIALQQDKTLEIVNLTDNSQISVPSLPDDYLLNVFIDSKRQLANLFYQKAGLQQYSLENQTLLFSNTGCQHNYRTPPLQFNNQPWLVSHVSEGNYILCHLQDSAFNQAIHSSNDDLVSVSEDETLIYFQDSGRSDSTDTWDISAQQLLPDVKAPLSHQLKYSTARAVIKRTDYDTSALDLAPLSSIAVAKGVTISITASAVAPKISGQLPAFEQVQRAAHGWHLGEQRTAQVHRAQLFRHDAQSGWFELDTQRSSRVITTDSRQRHIVLVQTELPRYEHRDDELWDISVGTSLTLVDFASGEIRLTQQVLAWTLNPARDTLLFVADNGTTYSADLTSDTLAVEPIKGIKIDFESYSRMFSGLDSDNMLLVNHDFSVQALSLNSKKLSEPIPLTPDNDQEKLALTLSSSTIPTTQQRYMLVDYGSRKVLLDIAQQQQQDVNLDDGAEYKFDANGLTLYFSLPGERLAELSLKNLTTAKQYQNINIGYNPVDTTLLTDDVLLLTTYDNAFLLQTGSAAYAIEECDNSEVRDIAYEPASQLLAKVSSQALCVTDAQSLQPVLLLRTEDLQLDNNIVAVFFSQPEQLTLLLEDGNKVSLPIATELKTLLEKAKNRHLSNKLQSGITDNAA